MAIRELLTAADFFSEPLVLLSSDGTIDTSNQQFADELGLPAQALGGRRLDALAAASALAIQEYVRACAESTRAIPGSLVLRRRAETVTLQARGVAYPPSAAPSASQVLMRLVTQQDGAHHTSTDQQSNHWREVEDSLRRQSQILEVTLASIGDGVIVTDARGRVTFLNSVAESLTGWSAQSARGRALADLFHIINELTRRPVEDPVSKVLETGRIVGLANHTVLVARDGREIPIDDSAAPIRLPGGQLFGVVLIFRDITEQRRAEHTRAWLASIVESSDDAIVSKTLDGRITSWNPGAVRLFGYSPTEMIGQPIMTVVPPELYQEELDVLARLRRGERVEHFETTRLAKDGRRVEVSLTVSPIRDAEGMIVGASKVARDITERKRAERLLREGDRRKDEFLAMLAHELRNPLAPMRNAAELLRREHLDRPASRLACEIIDRQLRQMTRLVDDLLDVSRITAGRIDLQIEPIELEPLLRTIEAALRPGFEAAQQDLTLRFPQESLYIYGDRIRLVQVLSNILQNANKYTPLGGSVSVEVRREDADIAIRIRDNGIGIPSEMLDQVFELFTQADPAHQRSSGGLGIGLTIARRLIELHGGSIEARSAGKDKGTEFVVRLPARAPPAPEHETAAAPPAVPPARRILIADDNEDAASILSALLQSMGHETRVAHDGVAALEIAEAFQPQVIVIDLDASKLDGDTVAQQIATQSWANHTLLVALTGSTRQSKGERGRATGFHHQLVKPVDLDTLQSLLVESERLQHAADTR